MATKKDVIEAKEILSARLLAAGVRHKVIARRTTMRLREAVPNVSANVHAVGIGRKLVDGKPTSTLAVRLYVVQKLAMSAIPPRDLLPKTVDGVPCDVIETPPAFAGAGRVKAAKKRQGSARRTARERRVPIAARTCTSDRRRRQRPFPAGISVAHRDVTAGTIAYFCRSIRPGDTPGDVFVLSNNHVLADVNSAAIGDDVLQPGPADGGTSTDHIADLHRFVRIRLGGDLPNRVDAAIARIRARVAHTVTMCSIGAITGIERGVEDMRVRKHGRTTGLTEGVITDESVDSLVGMDHNDPSVVGLFKGQLRIERTASSTVFGLGGDSGSLVVAADSLRAVGLYFAGPDSGIYGLANQISDVLKELEVQLVV
jgi:hypothetical protein